MWSSKERHGVIPYVVFSGLSLISVSLLLGALSSWRQTIRPLGLFFLLLLFWEFVQAFTGVMTLRWVVIGDVEPGTYCIAQAILNSLNATGTALATIGLSWCILHNYVFQARDLSLTRAFIVLAAMSTLQIAVILIPSAVIGVNKLYQPSGIWCWLPETQYYALKTVSAYMFYWIAVGLSMSSALAYLASAYVGKRLPCGYFWIGFLTRRDGLLRMGFFSELVTHDRVPKFGFTVDVLWFGSNKSIFFVQYLDPPPEVLMPPTPEDPVSDIESQAAIPLKEHETPNQAPEEHEPPNVMRDAMMLLSFPVAYTVFVVALSVARNKTFGGHKIGLASTLGIDAWFALTGIAEVILFVLLQPDFGLRLPRILEGLRLFR